MLVLSRKVGERIIVGDQITITVVRVSGGGVRLGIEAPENLMVVREELQTESLSDSGSANKGPSDKGPSDKGSAVRTAAPVSRDWRPPK